MATRSGRKREKPLVLESFTYRDFILEQEGDEQIAVNVAIEHFNNLLRRRKLLAVVEAVATVQPSLFDTKVVDVTVRALVQKLPRKPTRGQAS